MDEKEYLACYAHFKWHKHVLSFENFCSEYNFHCNKKQINPVLKAIPTELLMLVRNLFAGKSMVLMSMKVKFQIKLFEGASHQIYFLAFQRKIIIYWNSLNSPLKSYEQTTFNTPFLQKWIKCISNCYVHLLWITSYKIYFKKFIHFFVKVIYRNSRPLIIQLHIH